MPDNREGTADQVRLLVILVTVAVGTFCAVTLLQQQFFPNQQHTDSERMSLGLEPADTDGAGLVPATEPNSLSATIDRPTAIARPQQNASFNRLLPKAESQAGNVRLVSADQAVVDLPPLSQEDRMPGNGIATNPLVAPASETVPFPSVESRRSALGTRDLPPLDLIGHAPNPSARTLYNPMASVAPTEQPTRVQQTTEVTVSLPSIIRPPTLDNVSTPVVTARPANESPGSEQRSQELPATETAPGELLPVVESAQPPKNQPQELPPQPVRSQEDEELLDWWNYQLADPSRKQAQPWMISLESLIDLALQQSPRIRTMRRIPQITGVRVDQALSQFDPIIQLETGYTDTMDPVGNSLTTGGAPFLEENRWNARSQLSRRLEGGSDLSIYQKLGFQNSNSNFFTPQDQGTSTIGADLRVPMGRGAGHDFNQSPIIVAELETDVSWSDYQVELQKEIFELGTLYWNLQNARAIYLQQQRSVERARDILGKLEARADYDTSISQIAQAKAEYSLRLNELQSSLQTIKELEITIRERVGDPNLASPVDTELIPLQFVADVFQDLPPDFNRLMESAIENRFELQSAMSKSAIAQRQAFVSRCGLAPRLDLVFNVYASSLQGDTGIERAFQEQFTNAPGYSGGLEYELPYGRRSAKAKLRQAQLQQMQATDLLQVKRNEIVADVQKAYNRWQISRSSYHTARQAVSDMRRSVQQLQMRWEEFAFVEGAVSQGATPSLALDQLLAGQRRLSETEARLATAELNVALAKQGLLSATGSLFHTKPMLDGSAELPVEEDSYVPLPPPLSNEQGVILSPQSPANPHLPFGQKAD